MRKLFTSLFAATMASSFTAVSFIPAQAAPIVPRVAAPANVVDVQSPGFDRRSFRQDRRQFRRGMRQDRRQFRRAMRQDRRQFRQANRVNRGFYRNDGRGFYNGHRGYRSYRPGYRRHNDFWFPAAAFITGAIVGGAINSGGTVYRGNSSHVQWCYDRYRSYRASDNTFQPYNGPRRACYSPYS